MPTSPRIPRDGAPREGARGRKHRARTASRASETVSEVTEEVVKVRTRERLLDLRDAVDDADALMAVGVDLRLPGRYDYTWEGLESCLRAWEDPMIVRALVDGEAGERCFERLSSLADELAQLTVEPAEVPDVVLEPDPDALPPASPRELERSTSERERPGEAKRRPQRSPARREPARAERPRRLASDDEMRAARLIAANMAAKGRDRTEVERYLDTHFALEGVDDMLDDVYSG